MTCFSKPASQYSQHPFLAQRVRDSIDAWKRIGASSHVESWIQQGVPIEFTDGPPPAFCHRSAPLVDAEAAWWAKEKLRLCGTGAIEPAQHRTHVSRAFLVPKKNGGFRLVINLRPVNPYCVKHSCRYESLKVLQSIATQDCYMFAMDLQDGYHCLNIRPEDRRCVTFELQGEVFQCAALPFGWCNSPFYFSKLMRVFVQHIRAPFGRVGLRVLPYLDDFLFLIDGLSAAHAGVRFVQDVLSMLGLVPHPTKSHWEPTQELCHLGFYIDTHRGLFYVPAQKVRKISVLAKDLICRALRSQRWVSHGTLASFCGVAVSALLAIPPARFFLRELYLCLHTDSAWPGHVKLSKQALADLRWWAALPPKWNGRPIWRVPTTRSLHTDASGAGWGAVLDGDQVARGFWRPGQAPLNICCRELLAVRLGVESFLPLLANCQVMLGEDNTAALAAITKLSARSVALMQQLRRLWWVLETNNVFLQAAYVPSAANLADGPSRLADRDDYQLDPAAFAWLDALFGPHTVDRFATANNTQLRRFNSQFADPLTEAVDAFAQDWAGEVNWMNPPFDARVLLRVAHKIRWDAARATVITPHWPAQPWYRELAAQAQAIVHLPARQGLFRPGATGVPAPPPRWDVTAFIIRPPD